MEAFSDLTDLERVAAYDTLLRVRLSLVNDLGPLYALHPVSAEPLEFGLDGEAFRLDFEHVSYYLQPSGEIIEMWDRGHFLDCRALDPFGRIIGKYRWPLGRPEWN